MKIKFLALLLALTTVVATAQNNSAKSTIGANIQDQGLRGITDAKLIATLNAIVDWAGSPALKRLTIVQTRALATDYPNIIYVTNGTTGLFTLDETDNTTADDGVNTLVTTANNKRYKRVTGSITSISGLQTALDLKANLASPTFTGTIGGITKSMVGLANVDNSSDANKPVSTAQQAALDLKANLASPTFTGTVGGITKAMVGLGNVDNISDANKPVSTAQQTALNLKANLASPTFTGTVGGITKAMVGLSNVDNISDANKPVSTAQQAALDLKLPYSGGTLTGGLSGTTATFSGALSTNGIQIWRNGTSTTTRNIGVGSTFGSIAGGYQNVALGDTALFALTSGYSNVAIGHYAMWLHQSGNQNVAIGEAAMRVNTTGTNNVAVGYQALINNTNSSNTALGYRTLAAAGGAGNIALGYDAGSNNLGANNIFVGNGAGNAVSGTRNGNVFVGGFTGSTVNTSNGSYFSNGIGTRTISFDGSAIPTFHGLTTGYFKLASGVGSVSSTIPSSDITGTFSPSSISATDKQIIFGNSGTGYQSSDFVWDYANSKFNVNGRGNFVTGASFGNDGTPSWTATNGGVDIFSGGIPLVIGADAGFSSRTTATTKLGQMALTHYLKPEEPLALVTGSSGVNANIVSLGGNSNLTNAATQVRVYTAANNATLTGNEVARWDSLGRFGIGTTTPAYPVHITVNSGSPAFGITRTSVGTFVNAISGAMTNSAADLIFDGGQSSSGYLFRTRNSSNTTISALGIDRDGNIGIGTTAPNAKLQIGNVVANRILVLNEVANNDHQYYGFGVTAVGLRYQISTTSTAHAWYAGNGTAASNELMRVTGTGNLGVGTTNPLSKLHIAGASGTAVLSLQRTPYTAGSSIGATGFMNSAGNYVAGVKAVHAVDSTNADLILMAGGANSNAYANTERIKILGASGYTGIGGITTPLAKLHVYHSGLSTAFPVQILEANGTGGRPYQLFKAENANYGYMGFGATGGDGMHIINYQNSTLQLGTNNTFYQTIVANGNVGFGTSSPTSKMQVVGLPTYVDNTAALAGGLTAGAFYRTSTGQLMVTY